MVSPDDVKGYIQGGLDCDHISVIGDGQHFEAFVESPSFKGKGLVAQHKMVYATLGTSFESALHALALKTSAPS